MIFLSFVNLWVVQKSEQKLSSDNKILPCTFVNHFREENEQLLSALF